MRRANWASIRMSRATQAIRYEDPFLPPGLPQGDDAPAAMGQASPLTLGDTAVSALI